MVNILDFEGHMVSIASTQLRRVACARPQMTPKQIHAANETCRQPGTPQRPTRWQACPSRGFWDGHTADRCPSYRRGPAGHYTDQLGGVGPARLGLSL